MRISTQQIYDGGTARLGEIQTALAKTQQQIATGRKLLAPSDDPVAAARALNVAQSQSINSQYAANRVQAKNSLGTVDGVLAGITELLQVVRTSTLSVGNPSVGNGDRATLATELGERFKHLLGLANTRDAQGNYLFSGFQTATVPFVDTPTGASYQGDAGQQLVQVDSNRQLAMSNPGIAVFQGGGQDIFQTLKDLTALLNTPVTTPAGQAALSAGLATAMTNIDRALDNVSTVRASVGARLQELDALDTAGDQRDVQYSAILSEIQDLDYTRAITRLSQQQTTLEAAQKSFVKTSSLSLFNYL